MVTLSDVLTNLKKHVKTSCRYVNITNKAENPQ